MIETISPPTSLQESIDRAFDQLDKDATAYGARFAESYHPIIQDSLPIFEHMDESIINERIERYSHANTGFVGGDTEFVTQIARYAFIDGLGIRQRAMAPDDVSETELFLSTEELENASMGQPEPTPKMPKQDHYIDVFTRRELADFVAYWYRIGMEDRLSGFAKERSRLDAIEFADEKISEEYGHEL